MTQDPGLASWLQLALTPGLGPAALRELLKKFGLPKDVLARRRAELAPHLSAQAQAALDSAAVLNAVEQALAWAALPGCRVLTLADEDYPRRLLEITDPPAVLYAHGRTELLALPALAIVGSRNATAQGLGHARSFSRAFSGEGITIVSGLALGIDAAAHQGALEGPGSTIAVLGTGIDVCYPKSNQALQEDIAGRGLLLSEFPLGAGPAAYHFPRRNRLISGLSLGCLVVEAAVASGSLITARAAADHGREVFAIPGSIHSPLSRGCHALIKSGAKLVESAEDVLSELSMARPVTSASNRRAVPPRASNSEDGLLSLMGHDPVDVDSLCSRAGMSAEKVSSELLRLELEGRISALPGGLYQRTGDVHA